MEILVQSGASEEFIPGVRFASSRRHPVHALSEFYRTSDPEMEHRTRTALAREVLEDVKLRARQRGSAESGVADRTIAPVPQAQPEAQVPVTQPTPTEAAGQLALAHA